MIVRAKYGMRVHLLRVYSGQKMGVIPGTLLKDSTVIPIGQNGQPIALRDTRKYQNYIPF
jgi:hypothetical protein